MHGELTAAVFSLAAGTVAMASEAAWTASHLLQYGAGIAPVLLGLALLRASSATLS